MKKRNQKLLSLFLSAMMVVGVVPSTVYAAPEQATEIAVEQEAGTEATNEDTVINENEADASADQAQENTDEAQADDTAQENEAAAEEAEAQTASEENAVDSTGFTFTIPEIKVKGANAAVAEALTKDVELDETNPAIQGLRKELESLEIAGGEAGASNNEANINTADLYDEEADGQAEKQGLTPEQIDTVLKLYQVYQKQWVENADVLGVQNPFFLDFNDNDNNEDKLGGLGEMLALAGVSVEDVRNGNYSYDDLTGMITTFTYGDKLGIEYFRPAIETARKDALAAVNASGAQTKAQKLLVLNDWLAHNNTFDMAYIMNSDKETMTAEHYQGKPHEGDVKEVIKKDYEDQLRGQYHDQVYEGVKAGLRTQFYENAIRQIVYKQALNKDEDTATDEEKAKAQKTADDYLEQNKKAIEDDPDAYVRTNFNESVADELKTQADDFIKGAEEEGVEVDPEKNPGVKMTVEQITQQKLNDIIDEAVTGMTTGVVNYWEGSHIGAFGMGTSVCLGYSKAFSYLVQCLDTDVYLKNPEGGYGYENWKTAEELYYTDGKLDITKNYTVDLARISFQSNVTMYGEEQKDFGSDHYWNAVKLYDKDDQNGQWYFIDPCYTDVYTEVMSRDRVETDGDMNHTFFLFSQTSVENLYSGNINKKKGIRSLYKDVATDQSYEKSWMARAASNVYYEDGYAYYMYDSTDLFDRVNSSSMNQKSAEYKIVRHKLTTDDKQNGDSDYETLINFTDKPKSNNNETSSDNNTSSNDDTFVSVLKDGEMEKNELFTKLYAQFVDEQSIYPSIGLTAALYKGKIYFNVSNDIVAYNPADGSVAVVKEYNEVSAVRDNTKLFGGMAFTTTANKEGATFTVENHPIAGLTVKGDKLVVSIATNYAFISGKTGLDDTEHYGYAFEETDYNPTYTNYKKYQQFMGNQKNDNDEFMWSANFVDTVDLTKLTGSHKDEDFTEFSIPATCGRNAFTEKRCPDCGLIKDGSRVEQKDTAHEHHYIKFHEVYYTKSDNVRNEADNYVCPECRACITEPVKPTMQQANSTYEKRKAIWDAAQKNAVEGHDYTVTDGKWSDDKTSVTFQNLECKACSEQINKIDCLLEKDDNATNKANRDSIKKTLANAETVNAKLVSHNGTCETGVTAVYKASGKTEDGTRYTAIDTLTTPAGEHKYKGKWTWEETKDGDGNVTDATAKLTDVKCEVCKDEPKDDQTKKVVVKKDAENSKAATCTEAGKDVYVATATITDADGKEIGSLTDTHEVELKALGHKYGETDWKWAEDHKSATATRVCENDPSHVDTAEVKVEEKSEGATCTKGGKITYTATAKYADGTTAENSVTVDSKALGHDYKVSEDGWTWTYDKKNDTYEATAKFVCSRCKEIHEVEADVVKNIDDKGQTVYTATATYEDATASSTKTIIPSIYYQVHRQDYGWEVDEKDEADLTKWKSDGAESGTVGESKRLEGIKIQLPKGVSGSVEYRTHIQNTGWETKWKKDGELSGTSGKSLRLEAIQVKLTGKVADNYDVYYCVHAQNVGWLNWAKNGEEAGTAGYGYRLEAIKIMLVPKGEKAPAKVGDSDKAMEARLVGYQTHVQDFGTQAYVYDGAVAGTSGQAKRMESIRINLPSTMASEGKIEYRSHVQNIGWEKDWKQTNQLSGTTGKSLRLEAIQMKLSGNIAKEYDVYYRVHAQNFGWLGWAKNGEEAGTAGYSYRLEAIQVVMVPKGTENPQLPGVASATKEAFIQK
ncbi:hypothetical protein KQH93_05510 [Coprococcus comes]|nr:hypothetical protein [Coprococcus comes]